MATVTHYIYSHYDPPPRKEGNVTPEANEIDEEEDPWVTESTFGARRRIQNPPRFVPASISYDEVNNMIGGASSSIPREVENEPRPSSKVSDWYKSLPRASSAPAVGQQPSTHSAVPTSAKLASQLTNPNKATVAPPRPSKNDWFISKAIMSEPATPRGTPAPTLADILSREPPPDRKDDPFVPPVFLHIGPSNKGFTMLQRHGWSEGEALGASAPRRTASQKAREKMPARTILDGPHLTVKTEAREVVLDGDDDICEVRNVEVVDLTLSDSDEDEALEALASHNPGASQASTSASSQGPSHKPTALLTPIATVLKSDRLGIGLKAKTVGPHKESKKRVTHNQAALAAHIRATEEMRMRKALLGRGANSFARLAKAEAESRKRLLAHLNSD
ncbi:hypothetical protein ONZ51_g10672 [Trametes cubensis]|uniref:G-patch domain-containing protein n=1 Tax=Trametes cubensis TaxID=1111947 RepID=A0AAD7TJ06_9APHY|nr:hypothetical protein ONZ51_g10672 [Trametes cubensis]